ncbi:MAG TPA: NAD-dependent epimerase/dehydratase family protein [Candidatus Woesebacteria bacterium]|nr:NAD-dependent epimerase/dehydratase family protein [Candidatus Woesebacteria bacterium]
MSKSYILVTGGAGHVGSHLIERLVKNPNYQVISLDNYFNGSKNNHIDGAEYREGHTKDIDKLIPEKIDVIFHLGEYARVTPSFEDVDKVLEMNVIGTARVVEYWRKSPNCKLVYAGSSTRFAIEGDGGHHQNPYAYSKATNVDLINNYGKWYGLPYAICYFCNAFGPREKGEGKYGTLIAKFEQMYLKGQPFTIVKPGTQKRNFTYVGDLAQGMILVAEKGEGDGYTLGSNHKYSIIEIAEAFGGKIEYIDGYPGRAEMGEAPNKAREELGWKTTIEVIDYIKDFVAKNKKPSLLAQTLRQNILD